MWNWEILENKCDRCEGPWGSGWAQGQRKHWWEAPRAWVQHGGAGKLHAVALWNFYFFVFL